MHPSEIRNLSQTEIARRLDESYQELFNLRFQYSTGQLKNTARLGQVRQEIARLRTIMRERELAVPGPGVAEKTSTARDLGAAAREG